MIDGTTSGSDTASGRPTVVVLGPSESGADLLARFFELTPLIRIDRLPTRERAPDTDAAKVWLCDVGCVMDPLVAARPGELLLVVAHRPDDIVIDALASRHGIGRDAAAATWRTQRRRAEQAMAEHPSIIVDVERFVADIGIAAEDLARRLRDTGVDPGDDWSDHLDELLREVDRLPTPPQAPAVQVVAAMPLPIGVAPAAVPARVTGSWELPPPRHYAVIILANVCWNSREQRPQHLARVHATHGHPVFYLSQSGGDLGQELEVAPGVVEVEFTPRRHYDRYSMIADDEVMEEWMVAVDELVRRHGIDDAVVHVQLQSWTPFAWRLRTEYRWKIVYDCMDEWEGFPGMGRQLLEAELDLVRNADLVVVTADRLRQKWAPHQPNTLLLHNAVDAEFFSTNCVPSDVLAGTTRPIIGFTGGLASWVDFELLETVARARPEWSFVLVGDIHVGPSVLAGLCSLPNVHLPGLQPYTSMPHYLFWFDVCIIPFVVDQISAAVDPVKFYEYCASGTPIVSTRLPELDEHRHLFHEATDAASFETAIAWALAGGDADAGARRELARRNTWEDRYATLHPVTERLWPTLSVVIVTYGQLHLTRRCVETLLGNTSHPSLDVIVVDNGSGDGTPAYLRHVAAHDRRVRVVLNDTNRGFAAANNQGLELATGSVLILLNNDTEVHPGWHVPLLQHLEDPTIGAVGPRSDNVGNAARIDVPPAFHDDLAGFTGHLAAKHRGESFEIRMLGMFCVAMRREVYESVGPLDEGYGIGLFEDDDYAERIRDAGWRIVCSKDAFVHHVGQGTFRLLIDTGEYDELWRRNQARFEERWGDWQAQTRTVSRAEVGSDVQRDVRSGAASA